MYKEDNAWQAKCRQHTVAYRTHTRENAEQKIEKLYLGMDENVVKSLAQIFPSSKHNTKCIKGCVGTAVAWPARK